MSDAKEIIVVDVTFPRDLDWEAVCRLLVGMAEVYGVEPKGDHFKYVPDRGRIPRGMGRGLGREQQN